MKKDPYIFINHILESIDLIQNYSLEMTVQEFKNNRAMQDAMTRRLEIIGEAVKNLSNPFKDKYPDIPWKSMAGMRDILIHEYFAVDLQLTWKVITRELPLLKTHLQNVGLIHPVRENFRSPET